MHVRVCVYVYVCAFSVGGMQIWWGSAQVSKGLDKRIPSLALHSCMQMTNNCLLVKESPTITYVFRLCSSLCVFFPAFVCLFLKVCASYWHVVTWYGAMYVRTYIACSNTQHAAIHTYARTQHAAIHSMPQFIRTHVHSMQQFVRTHVHSMQQYIACSNSYVRTHIACSNTHSNFWTL